MTRYYYSAILATSSLATATTLASAEKEFATVSLPLEEPSRSNSNRELGGWVWNGGHGGWDNNNNGRWSSPSRSSSSSGKSGKSGSGKSGKGSSSSSSSSSGDDYDYGPWGKPPSSWDGPPGWGKPPSSSSSSSSSGKSGKSGGGSKGSKGSSSSSSSSVDDKWGPWGKPPSLWGNGWDNKPSSSSSSSSSSGKSGKSGGGSKGSKGSSSSSISSSSDGKWGRPPGWGRPSSSSSSSGKSGKSGGSKSSKGSKGTSSSSSGDGGHWVWVAGNNDDDDYGWLSSSSSSSSSSGKSGKSGGSSSGKSGKGPSSSIDNNDDDGYWEGDGWMNVAGGGVPKLSDKDEDEWSGAGYYNYPINYCHASCEDDICTYTSRVDLFASEFGFYFFEECKDLGNMPTITMELGKTYRFVQEHVSNYFHPLGFAYEPDGALADADELEEEYLSYQLDEEDIGLDGYEPMFGHPIDEWATDGNFIVEVTIPNDFDSVKDLFYFCHIHRYLGGRIKLTKDGHPIQPHAHLPTVSILPPPQSSYDKHCGTYGLVTEWQGDSYSWPHSMEGDHRLPHPECPHTFVCQEDKSTFASCLDAINCHMFNGMTTYERNSEVALFLHQMIPHHQNAVNMAKSLLLHWDYNCDAQDLGEDTSECVMENIIRSIIAAQNAQIQTMRDLLASNDWPEFDDCDVPIKGSAEGLEHGSEYTYGPWYWGDDGHDNADRNLLDKKTVVADTVERASNSHGGRGLDEDGICRASCSTKNGKEICIFTVGVDLNAADLGAFYFEECGSDNTYPVIGIEVGKSYVFVQEDRSNYYHPLGFAYHPDGAHNDKDEVEEDYLTYRVDTEDVGLDGYEPLFFHSPGEWTDYGTFTVELNYNKDYDQDLFYFCHIHNFMSGRMKLLKNDKPIQPANLPPIKYSHPEPSEYDKSCGTYGLAPFQLPHPECPKEFVCDKNSEFAGCIETMNCFMMVGMTTYADGGNDGDVALFNHQMIPHHENAVNMAKALLKTEILDCESLSDDTDDCSVERILREIINNQNYQIQLMYEVLKDEGFGRTNDCVIDIHHHKLRG